MNIREESALLGGALRLIIRAARIVLITLFYHSLYNFLI